MQNLLRDLDTVFLFTKTAHREKHPFFLYVFYLAHHIYKGTSPIVTVLN